MSKAGHHNIPGAPPTHKPDIPNPGAEGISYYTPAQEPPAGTALSPDPPGLFKPLKIRDLTLQNRLMLSPLCQYSAQDGHFTAWHMAHLGGIISRGPGISFIEATASMKNGRITPQDSGLWQDSQIEPLRQVVEFAHSQGQKIGIQLAHAGRKASTVAPWISGGATATETVGGWPENVWAPTAEAFADTYPDPKEMTLEQIEGFKGAWVAAVRRALKAGFDIIEIHNAHGYLLHEFLSPVSNKRTDKYGGSFENRTRLTLEVVELTRKEIPKGMPLFLRLSATDWLEEVEPDTPSWRVEDSVELAKLLVGKVDLLDVSSGGNSEKQRINTGSILSTQGSRPYQAPLAKEIKKAVGDKMLVGTVGGIKDGKIANQMIDEGLDLVAVGRQFQKNPGVVFSFADDLGIDVRMPNQIAWGFKGRGKPKKVGSNL